MVKRAQQQEMPGLPPMSELAKAAVDYLNKRDAMTNAQMQVDSAKKLLAIEFQAAGKSQIRISGRVLSYQHKETDSIIVKEDSNCYHNPNKNA